MTLKIDESSKAAGHVLVCAADESTARDLEGRLTELGYRTVCVEHMHSIIGSLSETSFDVCLVDWPGDGAPLATVAEEIHSQRVATQLVRIGGELSPETIHQSDWETLPKPCTSEMLARCLRSAVLRARLLLENLRLKQQLDRPKLRPRVSHNSAVRELLDRTAEIADENTPVLIKGETGTDVVEIAQAMHRLSWRNQRPLIKLECSVLSAECLLLELFGDSDPGSHPAVARRKGLIDTVEGGTLVLVDVDTIAVPVQRRLADMLHAAAAIRPRENTFTREPRVIATTQADLAQLADSGRFAADLCLLLNENVLAVSPLRERKEEIAGLVEGFLAQLAAREGRQRKRLTVEALSLLESHNWPGNHEELWSVLDRACALDAEEWLRADMVEPWLTSSTGRAMPGLSLRDMERKLIEATFARCGGNRERTAQSLQIGLRTLSGKLREYGYPPRGAPGSNLTTTHRKAA